MFRATACRSDEVSVICRVMLAPHYSTLRRTVAYLAGLLLLYRNAKSFQVETVLRALEEADAGLREACDGLLSVIPPKPLHKEHHDLSLAAKYASLGLSKLRAGLMARSGGLEEAEKALEPLRRSHRLLAAVHDDNAGMQMLNFADGCACGVQH